MTIGLQKRSFHFKCLSGIVDFAQDYSLLQFKYDKHIFKTVTGAVESGRKLHCSPKRALETKPLPLLIGLGSISS